VGNNAKPKFGLWHPEPNSLLETLVVNEHNSELQRFHLGNLFYDFGNLSWEASYYHLTLPNKYLHK
jgi:hypothetical protein